MLGALLAKKAARNAFAAMNRHDLEKFMTAWGDDPLFEFPGDTVLAGRYKGREEIRAWFERWWQRFPKTIFTLKAVSVDNIMAMGGTNTIHVEWDLEETDRAGETYMLSGVTALRARGGKVVEVKDYIFDQDVISGIWGPAPEASAPGADPR